MRDAFITHEAMYIYTANFYAHFITLFPAVDNVVVNCRGILNLGSNTYSVDCDSSRSLDFYLCQLNGIVIPCMHIILYAQCIEKYRLMYTSTSVYIINCYGSS